MSGAGQGPPGFAFGPPDRGAAPPVPPCFTHGSPKAPTVWAPTVPSCLLQRAPGELSNCSHTDQEQSGFDCSCSDLQLLYYPQ